MMLFSGTALAQFFNFASYPFLTRTYTPDDFGIFTIFLTIVLMTSAISCARFDAVITISKKYERIEVYKISILINMIISVTLGVFAYFFSNYFDFIYSSLLSLAVFLTGFCGLTSFFLLKVQKYSLNSVSLVVKSAFTALPQILLFYIYDNSFGLILGFCIGCICQALFLYFLFVKNQTNLNFFSCRKIGFVFFKYKSFIKYDVPSVILSTASFNIINFMIVDLFSSKEVGYYSLAYRIAAVPLSIFSNSLSQVFFQKASDAFEISGHFWQEFRYNLIISSVICFFVVLTVIYAAKPLVIIYLGEEWISSADIIISLLPLLATRFVSVSIASAFLVMKRPKVLMVNNAILLLVSIIIFFYSKNSIISFESFVYLYSISLSLIYIIFTIFVYSKSKGLYLSNN